MLRLYRRHETWCKLTSKAKTNCSPKVKGQGRGFCPVWITGTLPDGTVIKPRTLDTRNWQVAAEQALRMEAGEKPKEKPIVTSLREAAELMLLSKSKLSPDRQRKVKLHNNRLIEYSEKIEKKAAVQEIDFSALTRYMATWTDAVTTQITKRESLIEFFRFCVKAKYRPDNPAGDLPTIPATTPQTDVFTHEELKAIIEAFPRFVDEYGRTGQPIALQVKAFVLVMRYTGLSIGDVAGLPKSAINGNRILTNRDKTGKEVYVTVPDFVILALNAAPWDSEQYPFWTGNGKIHTRASKWGERIQKLFVLAGVRLAETDWSKRTTRSKKQKTSAEGKMRIFSQADPRWFRHTLARDLLENEIVTMEELAEILGNTLAARGETSSRV
jgi:site-specific recombinase XerD